jgi:hypothetical protein
MVGVRYRMAQELNRRDRLAGNNDNDWQAREGFLVPRLSADGLTAAIVSVALDHHI